MSGGICPTYHTGFYSPQRGGIAKYQNLWRPRIGAWASCLGPNGLVLQDNSGFGRHGALTNMAPASDWVVSEGKYALDFDGTDDYVKSPISKTVIGNTLTIALWICPRGAQSSRGIFQIADALTSGVPWILLRRESSTTIRWFLNADYRITNTVNDGVFVHVALTYDGVTWRSYLNGTESGSYVGAVGVNAGGFLWLGNGFGGYFNGLIDDCMIDKVAQTPATIALLASRRGIAYELAPRRRYRAAAAAARSDNLLLLGVS